jgi:hypothetical protein
MESYITPELFEVEDGWTIVASFNVFPRTFWTVRSLQPSFAVPFSLDFAGIVTWRKAKLGRADVIDRRFQQGRLFRCEVVSESY